MEHVGLLYSTLRPLAVNLQIFLEILAYSGDCMSNISNVV